jgi:hypothetical protein
MMPLGAWLVADVENLLEVRYETSSMVPSHFHGLAVRHAGTQSVRRVFETPNSLD